MHKIFLFLQIQTVLSFRNADNSFSEHHMLSSHTATIYVLEALAKTQAFFSIDPYLVQEIKRWVQLRQEDDGSFTPLPADMKINDNIYTKFVNSTPKFTYYEHSVELTAETLIVLHEIEIENDVSLEHSLCIYFNLKINLKNAIKHFDSRCDCIWL